MHSAHPPLSSPVTLWVVITLHLPFPPIYYMNLTRKPPEVATNLHIICTFISCGSSQSVKYKWKLLLSVTPGSAKLIPLDALHIRPERALSQTKLHSQTQTLHRAAVKLITCTSNGWQHAVYLFSISLLRTTCIHHCVNPINGTATTGNRMQSTSASARDKLVSYSVLSTYWIIVGLFMNVQSVGITEAAGSRKVIFITFVWLSILGSMYQ